MNLETIELVVTLVGILAFGVVWLLNRNAVKLQRWKMVARFEVADLEVATDGDEKRVSFCWYVEEDDSSITEVRTLLTAKRARELAGMLRIAASRGRTLGVARWHARHDGEGPKAST